MRRFFPLGVFLAFGLGCAGLGELTGDLTADLGGARDDDDAGDGDGDDDDDDDDKEEPEDRDVTQATPDCTVDMTDVLVGLPGYNSTRKGEAKGTVNVYKKPKGKVVAEITTKGMAAPDKDRFCNGVSGDPSCVFIAVSLESRGVPVYTVKNNHALVGLGRGGNILDEGKCQRRGWIELTDGLEVKPVADLVEGKMAYLRPGMSGQLFDGPDGDATDDVETPSDDLPVKVKSAKKVDERWWLEIDVLDKSPCEGDAEATATGWMPMHDSDGRMKFWFYTDC